MSNPQSSIPNSQLPYIDSICTESDGTPTILFHRFLTGLWQRTGGVTGVNTSDIQVVATEALTVAQTAATEATAAQTLANNAQTTANSALTVGNTALANAASAGTAANFALSSALLKSSNLGDLPSVAVARANLGLTIMPVTFVFDSCASVLNRGVPVTRAVQVPANFAGTAVWWGIPSTADTIFGVGLSRSPSSAIVNIGSINVVHSGTGFYLSLQGAVNLAAGDTLVVTSSTDATLGQVSFTFPLLLL